MVSLVTKILATNKTSLKPYLQIHALHGIMSCIYTLQATIYLHSELVVLNHGDGLRIAVGTKVATTDC